MLSLARLSLRRPRLALVAWIAVAAALALVGLGVSDRMSPSSTVIPGTESARAVHLAEAEFGPSVLVPILLEGPKPALERQGPKLVLELQKRDDTRTLSAWDAGPVGRQMRPQRDAALIIAAVARDDEYMYETGQDEIDATVDRMVSSPVRSYVSGTPALEQGLAEESVDTAREATLLTLPILFVALLLVLRAPVAALGLTVFSGVTALATMGVLALAGQVVDVAALTIALGSMGALVLAVGFGLLVFRRWREELASGEERHDHPSAALAASAAVATSGRAVLIGGTALIVALVVASQIGPTDLLVAEGIGVVVGAMLGVGGAVVVIPSALAAFGRAVQWLSFPAPPPLQRLWDRLVGAGNGVLRHAVVVGAFATVVLAALAVPALSLETGGPSPQRLPEDNEARIAYEEIQRVMGPGYTAPYNIVIVSDTRPITDEKLLVAIDRLQADIAKDKRVASVIGPAAIASAARQLEVLPQKLRESTKLLKGGKKDLGRLEEGLGTAGAGAQKLQAGLGDAASGAGQLAGGSGQARDGAGQLSAGLEKARGGASQVSGGLGQALDAAQRLRDGAAQALAGSQKLSGGIGTAAEKVEPGVPIVRDMATNVAAGSQAIEAARGSTQAVAGQLADAIKKLQAVANTSPEATAALNSVLAAQNAAGAADQTLAGAAPKVASAAAVANAFAGQVAELSEGLGQLYAGSSELASGIAQLQDGNAQLAAGMEKLAGGGGQLTTGIGALRDGAAQLEAGLVKLAAGNSSLYSGLSGATGPTGQLAAGLLEMESGVTKFRANLPSPEDLERLQKQSPGLFDSGYFVLAAVEGSRGSDRNQATFAVNLERGGNAGMITVVAKTAPGEPAMEALGEDLVTKVDRFAAKTKTEAALGGLGGQFGDFKTEGTERILPVIAGVALLVTLMLMLMLRAVPLPLVAVAFDLLAVAAAFGIVQLLFGGDDPPLGGPGQLSPVSIIGIFAAAFGVTIVYEVVLLQRAREHFLRTGDAHAAIRRGLRGSAAAATGAAVVMLAALVPWVATDFLTVAQFAVGLAAVVLIDALVVRPVLLPAAVRLLGRAAWWPGSRRAPAPGSAGRPPSGPAAGTPRSGNGRFARPASRRSRRVPA